MTASARLGFGIAALFAAGVVVVAVFGRHDSWFARAASANAVRCLAETPCPMIDANGSVTTAAPPLKRESVCASVGGWHDVPLGTGRVAVTCTDTKTYLYHMGRLNGPDAGAEQWTTCGDSTCAAEIAYLKQRML